MNKNHGINIGGSSILMIFVLLCLVTFSVLSYVSANADYKLTKKAAQSVTRYYEADAQAETRLALIDETLKKIADQTPKDTEPAAYYQKVSDALFEMDGVSAVVQDDQLTIQYQVEIDDHRALQVSLQPLFPIESPEKRYVLTAWQVIQTAEWESDDSISVWDGEEPFELWNGE